MNLISTFRQQHDQITQVASDLSQHLDSRKLAIDAGEVRQKLHNLLFRLKMHNTLEADALHSTLLQHQNRQIAGETSRLMEELTDMTEEFEQYQQYWSKSGSIESRPSDFIEETQMLLTVLLDRFNREDIYLFNRVEHEMMH